MKLGPIITFYGGLFIGAVSGWDHSVSRLVVGAASFMVGVLLSWWSERR